ELPATPRRQRNTRIHPTWGHLSPDPPTDWSAAGGVSPSARHRPATAFDHLLGGGQRRGLFPPHCGASYSLTRDEGMRRYGRVSVTRANCRRTPALSLSMCHCQESVARL